jgi:hypothetical protein
VAQSGEVAWKPPPASPGRICRPSGPAEQILAARKQAPEDRPFKPANLDW